MACSKWGNFFNLSLMTNYSLPLTHWHHHFLCLSAWVSFVLYLPFYNRYMPEGSISHLEVKFLFSPPPTTLPVPAGWLTQAMGHTNTFLKQRCLWRWRNKRVNIIMGSLSFFIYFFYILTICLFSKISSTDAELTFVRWGWGKDIPVAGPCLKECLGMVTPVRLYFVWSLLGFAQNLKCALEQNGWLDLAACQPETIGKTLILLMCYFFILPVFCFIETVREEMGN